MTIRSVLTAAGIALILTACAGTRPDHLGELRSVLAPCPDRPNCVGSTEAAGDRHIGAIGTASRDRLRTLASICAVIRRDPAARIVVDSDTYLYVEYTSNLLGFIDDTEFLVVPGRPGVQMRSASRLGYSDLGVNRARLEDIREKVEL